MIKHIEKLKNQLAELARIVNAFQSEAVQIRIVDRLLQEMGFEDMENRASDFLALEGSQINAANKNMGAIALKKPGATKMLRKLLQTAFFNESRSIAAIVDHCKEQFGSKVRAPEFSDILLKLVKQKRLHRKRSDDNSRFKYVRV
ncbi:hypothetical protein [Mucilaginibacter aquaedulcis]|uniref:hypothetical protein n=1 Tax=Mucilaginibacter aquaedulcis TaxID=1187081 RepID=UPI0025B3E17F|nr:hypothetical protein [Mucilaginibacter aquaedulcis]MDN3551244.1 hypothetical protein [Mucilaginibacter aquaedulcis]